MKTFLGLGMVALLLSTSCNNATKSTDGANNAPVLQQLTPDKNAERINLFLGFTDVVETDSSVIYTAKSLFNTDTVGLKAEVLKNIKPGINNEGQPTMDGFLNGVIKLSSIGAESDNFVKALSSLYAIPATGGMTKEVILPTVFSSNKVVADLSQPTTYTFKLFLENKTGEPAQLSFALDLYRKAIDIGEYNPALRAETIAAFEGK